MFIYKPNYSTDILYALYGVIILLLIAFFISQPTANNDIYMQMLAIDGILSDFDFSGVGGHPIGIAMAASFLKFCSVDPLITFYWIKPLIAALCFIINF